MMRLVDKQTGPANHVTTLTLPWEKRIRSRLRVVLDNGQEAGLFLERGSVLRGGDRLVSEEGDVVQVIAAEETLSAITGETPLQMSRACYHLGNRHAAIEITESQVRYLHDPVLDDMVTGLGLRVSVTTAPFEPEFGAYAHTAHNHG